MSSWFVGPATGTTYTNEPFVVEHITVDFFRVLYKMTIAEAFMVTEIQEVMWDYDSMCEVHDVVGYNLWHAE